MTISPIYAMGDNENYHPILGNLILGWRLYRDGWQNCIRAFEVWASLLYNHKMPLRLIYTSTYVNPVSGGRTGRDKLVYDTVDAYTKDYERPYEVFHSMLEPTYNISEARKVRCVNVVPSPEVYIGQGYIEIP